MAEGRDDAVVKIISQLQIDTSLAIKSVKDMATETQKSGDQVVKEAQRIAKETAAAWKQKGSADAQVANQTAQMWKQLAAEQVARDSDRLKHGVAVESQLAEAAKKSAAAQSQALRDKEKVEKEYASRQQQYDGLFGRGGTLDKQQASVQSQVQAEYNARQGMYDKLFARGGALDKQEATTQAQIQQEYASRQGMYERLFGVRGALDKQTIAEEKVADQAYLRDYVTAYNATKADAARYLKAQQASAQATTNTENSLPNLNAQLAAIQARIKLEHVGDMAVKERVSSLRQEASELQTILQEEGKLSKEEVARVAVLKQQAQAMNSQVSELSADKRSTLGGQFEQNLSRRLGWFATGTMFFGGMQQIKSGMSDVADIETKMVELTRVMNDPLLKVDELRKHMFDMAQEFGFDFQKVQAVMFEWASAGYNLKDSLEATKNSLMALNSAELTTEQVTNSMVGILKQWGMTVADMPHVLDLITKTADSYSIQSKDLIDGLLKSSGAAKNANLTFKETVAILTTMKEASGQSGAAVGSALNSIVNFFARDKSLNILEKSGIPTFADASAKKLRPLMDILKDLSNNWEKLGTGVHDKLMEDAQTAGLFTEEMAGAAGSLDTWNDLQKRDLLTAGANAQRRNYLLGLLKNFSQVYEVLKTEEEAQGYTQAKSALIMETYTKQVEQLKASLQEFGYSLATEGGLLDGLKKVVAGMRSTTEWFNNLSPAAKQAAIAVAEIMGAVAGLNFLSQHTIGAGLFDVASMLKASKAAKVAAAEKAAASTVEAQAAITAAQAQVTALTEVAAAAEASAAAQVAAAQQAVAAAEAVAVAEDAAGAERIAVAEAVAVAKAAAADATRAAEIEAYTAAMVAETELYTVGTEASLAASIAATEAHQAAAIAATTAAGEEVAAYQAAAAVHAESAVTVATAWEAVTVAEIESAQLATVAAGEVAVAWEAVTVAEGEAAATATAVGVAGDTAAVGIWAALGPILLIAAPLAIVGATIAVVNGHAERLQSAFKQLKEESDGAIRSSEAQVKTHSDNILMVQKLAAEYRTLEKSKREAATVGSVEAVKDAGDKQKEITVKVKEALGEETAARLEAAHFSDVATKAVIEAEKGKRDEVIKALDVQMKSYRENLREQIVTTIASIETIQKGEKGWASFATAWELIGRGFRSVMSDIKTAWFGMLQHISGGLGDFLDFQSRLFKDTPLLNKIPGMKGFGDDLAGYAAEARRYSSEMLADKDKVAAAWWASDDKMFKGISGRQQTLLASLREELNKLSTATATTATDPTTTSTTGEFGDPKPEKGMTAVEQMKALSKSIMDHVQALQAEGEATQSLLDLTKIKLEFHTRDKASTEELAAADKERATALGLIGKRQREVHVTAQAARDAYDALTIAQGRLNRATEAGNNAWEEMENQKNTLQKLAGTNANPMGQLSEEWWKLAKEAVDLGDKNNAATTVTIRKLDELKKQYDDGTLSLEQYIAALQKLESVTGLATEATAKLHDQEATAYKTTFTEQIKDALTARQEEIKATIVVYQDAIDQFDKVGSGADRAKTRAALERSFNDMRGIVTPVTGVSSGDVSSLVQGVMDQFANLNLGTLDPAAFSKLMTDDLATLRGFSESAQSYLDHLGDTTQRRLTAIGDELKQIDNDLKAQLKGYQDELDALDAQKKRDERDKATTDHNKSQKSLQDQINYYEMKGADKYAFEIAALRKQQADEDKKWSEEQTNWQRDDKRKAIQDKMEVARQEAQARKDKLEAERTALQEQQRLMTEALKALQTYITSEIATRKKGLEDRKKDLDATSKSIDEQLKKIDDKVVTALAKLASQGKDAYKRAQSLIGNITKGIRDSLPALQSAVDAANAITNSLGSGGGGSSTTTTTTTSNNGTSFAPVAMAEGGFVKGGRGGVRALIGEGKPYTGDEVVFTRQHAVPLLSQALATVMRSGPTAAPAIDTRAIVTAIREGVSNLSFRGVVEVRMPDGSVERQVVQLLSGLPQAMKGA